MEIFTEPKIREMIREEKMEKTKGRKEVNAKLLIVEEEESYLLYNSPVDKKPIVAASYSLLSKLMFSLGISSFIS